MLVGTLVVAIDNVFSFVSIRYSELSSAASCSSNRCVSDPGAEGRSEEEEEEEEEDEEEDEEEEGVRVVEDGCFASDGLDDLRNETDW